MKFCDVLNSYIEELHCLAKDIEKHSGISASTLSRYRSGERMPDKNSDSYRNLCRAIEEIAHSKGITYITADTADNAFAPCFDKNDIPEFEILRANFNTLISFMNISVGKLCKSLNYDASTVFRIRNGTRQPSDPTGFANATAVYTSETINDTAALSELSKLLDVPVSSLENQSSRTAAVLDWLITPHESRNNSVSDFLKKLDDFDLNHYIKAIHFNEIKIPSMPFQFPTSKYYYGLQEIMQSELDFLKATVLSPSDEPVILYSDMPMEEMSKDDTFPKKWMYGMACMLKKGLQLYQIHDLNRPFAEMMLGLESWIPMYMTGQITPYYLKESRSAVFRHFIRVSGAAALSGEAVTGHQSDGRYYLTKQKKELAYFRKRGEQIIECAEPLMDIYRADKAENFRLQLISDSRIKGARRNILPSPPIYTVSRELLERILAHNDVDSDTAKKIIDFAGSQHDLFLSVLSHSSITDEIPVISEEELKNYPITLSLSEMFCDKDIYYTYDELCEHIRETQQFAENNDNYTITLDDSPTFRNLRIAIIKNKRVTVSKSNSPAIHFVIRHPKLRAAIENFRPPLSDNYSD